jgi:hypothetical protein
MQKVKLKDLNTSKKKVKLKQKLCDTSSNSENSDESVNNEIEVNKTLFQFNRNEIFY